MATAATAIAQATGSAEPYKYVVGETVAPANLGPSLAEMAVPVHTATVVTSAGETMADLKFARTQFGPVLVEWNPRVTSPFLKTLPPAQAMTALAPVLSRHIPEGTALLAWWDVSREFRMLTGLDVVFGEHLGVPLFLPVAWHGALERVHNIESQFWQATADEQAHARFMRFVHALLAEPGRGLAELRELAEGRPAVLVLHVRDIILLGQLAAEKIGVAYRDITASGDIHGMVKSTHHWLEANAYTAYTVMRLNESDHQARVIALTDEASTNTLAVRLLPFISYGEVPDLPGVKLVYTANGFWVYEVTPKPAAVASSKNAADQ